MQVEQGTIPAGRPHDHRGDYIEVDRSPPSWLSTETTLPATSRNGSFSALAPTPKPARSHGHSEAFDRVTFAMDIGSPKVCTAYWPFFGSQLIHTHSLT